jgi:hypothetical protein
MIGVGVLRAGALLIAGKSMAALSGSDARFMGMYVAAFAVGGAGIGLLHRLPIPGMRYIAYAFGGIVAMFGVMLATQVETRHDLAEWVVFGCVGLVVGLGLAARQPA